MESRMTPQERLEALLAGKKIDRVPFFPFARGFCARIVGYPVSSIYNNPEKSFWAQLWSQEMYGYDGYPIFGYAAYGAWEFGGEVRFPTSEWEQATVIVRHPVESEEDVERLELPNVKTAGMLPMAMAFSKMQDKLGLPTVPSCGTPFTRAGNICGLDRLCRWMIKRPQVAHKILRLVTEHVVDVARYWVDTFGAERVTPFSSTPAESNQVISPKQFKEFALPYMKEAHERVLAMGIKGFHCHICGEQNANLPYLAKVPMGSEGIVTFGHEVDLSTAIEYFGDSCIIAGNVEPAVILNETPQQVYEISKQCIEKGKQAPRGFMLMAGCEVSPMTPPYNIHVMAKAVNEFGWYD